MRQLTDAIKSTLKFRAKCHPAAHEIDPILRKMLDVKMMHRPKISDDVDVVPGTYSVYHKRQMIHNSGLFQSEDGPFRASRFGDHLAKAIENSILSRRLCMIIPSPNARKQNIRGCPFFHFRCLDQRPLCFKKIRRHVGLTSAHK